MSEYYLTVGKGYEKRRRIVCLGHMQNLGLVSKGFFGGFKGDNAKWTVSDREIAAYSLLNLATVCVFTDHVAQVMRQTPDILMEHETLGNLPWWMDSVWLPVDFSQHRAFEDDADGPFFLGSVPRLLAALDEVKRQSHIALDRTPASYSAMCRDPRGFVSDFHGLKDNDECVQWVWNALYEAATHADKQHLPVLGNGL